jgi:hypothetical protein
VRNSKYFLIRRSWRSDDWSENDETDHEALTNNMHVQQAAVVDG